MAIGTKIELRMPWRSESLRSLTASGGSSSGVCQLAMPPCSIWSVHHGNDADGNSP